MMAWQPLCHRLRSMKDTPVCVWSMLSKTTGISVWRKIDTVTEPAPYQTEGPDKSSLEMALCFSPNEMFLSVRIPQQRLKWPCHQVSQLLFLYRDEGRPWNQLARGPVLAGVLNQLPQSPDRKILPAAKGVLMTEPIRGSDLISLNFSVKPLVGHRWRRQIARLVTSGCVCNKDQSERPESRRGPMPNSFSSTLCGAWGETHWESQ